MTLEIRQYIRQVVASTADPPVPSSSALAMALAGTSWRCVWFEPRRWREEQTPTQVQPRYRERVSDESRPSGVGRVAVFASQVQEERRARGHGWEEEEEEERRARGRS